MTYLQMKNILFAGENKSSKYCWETWEIFRAAKHRNIASHGDWRYNRGEKLLFLPAHPPAQWVKKRYSLFV